MERKAGSKDHKVLDQIVGEIIRRLIKNKEIPATFTDVMFVSFCIRVFFLELTICKL